MKEVLLNALADELSRGADLIRAVDDIAFTTKSMHTGTIGGQLRHNLDMAICLLRGFESGAVDHVSRNRDARMENDREYATRRYEDLVETLRNVDASRLDDQLWVRSEVDPQKWFRSETEREIEFVYSHTIHHHALIAEKLASMGLDVPSDLGVAPSTLEYWKRAA